MRGFDNICFYVYVCSSYQNAARGVRFIHQLHRLLPELGMMNADGNAIDSVRSIPTVTEKSSASSCTLVHSLPL